MRKGPIGLPDRNSYLSNLSLGLSIALFIYFLKESALLEHLLAYGAVLALRSLAALAGLRSHLAASRTAVLCDLATILVAAYLWSSLRSVPARLAGALLLGVLLVPVSIAVYRESGVLLTAPAIALATALAIAAGSAVDRLSRLIHLKILVEKQEAEFSILGHLNHNVKPNLQIARSPIDAVLGFLEERDLLGSVLAQRLDGSDETVGAALHQALVSLDQISDILENTRKLVTQEIRKEDFGDYGLVALLRREIVPLYAHRLRIVLEGDERLAVRLHRESFVEAVNNLVRNALTHGYPDGSLEAELRFVFRERRKKVIIDYTNNGRPFPANLTAEDFVSFGKKSTESPGEGMGGAWIGKFLEAHRGTLEVVRDGHPLHFRITLPKGGI